MNVPFGSRDEYEMEWNGMVAKEGGMDGWMNRREGKGGRETEEGKKEKKEKRRAGERED